MRDMHTPQWLGPVSFTTPSQDDWRGDTITQTYESESALPAVAPMNALEVDPETGEGSLVSLGATAKGYVKVACPRAPVMRATRLRR